MIILSTPISATISGTASSAGPAALWKDGFRIYEISEISEIWAKLDSKQTPGDRSISKVVAMASHEKVLPSSKTAKGVDLYVTPNDNMVMPFVF